MKEHADIAMAGLLIIHTDNIFGSLYRRTERGEEERREGEEQNSVTTKTERLLPPLLCLKALDVVLGFLFFWAGYWAVA
jgi:hypothetical protein